MLKWGELRFFLTKLHYPKGTHLVERPINTWFTYLALDWHKSAFQTRHSPVVIFPHVLPGSDLQSAPLQTVLDNLDVLEELVILLDPESPGVKNTSHLASRCSFPATWITYTYSLRESKSPLRAVLEGVTTKHPEWTVGHLARLLREMDRNDTVVVLTKLSLLKVF